MNERQPYAVVDIRWARLPAFLKYPERPTFGLTGYREADGPAGIFSVYGNGSPGKAGGILKR